MNSKTGIRDHTDRQYLLTMVATAGLFAVGALRGTFQIIGWMFPTSPPKDSLLELAALLGGMFGLPLLAGFSAFAGCVVWAYVLSRFGDQHRVRYLLTFQTESSLIVRLVERVLPRSE